MCLENLPKARSERAKCGRQSLGTLEMQLEMLQRLSGREILLWKRPGTCLFGRRIF
ncbi:hypothetical protein PTKIN_Ptkin09bG0068600 [Pterospermum kingtungense]